MEKIIIKLGLVFPGKNDPISGNYELGTKKWSLIDFDNIFKK